MKTYRCISSCILIICALSGSAQDSCSTPRLAKIIEMCRKINVSKINKLQFKRYSSFNFESFTPLTGRIDSNDYFEVGYDSKGTILEITHHAEIKSPLNYKFLVFDLTEIKLLVIQKKSDGGYAHAGTAIIMFKRSNEYYMISFIPRFGTNDSSNEYSTFSTFDVADLKQISSIMSLGKDLYPTHALRLSEGRVVISSLIYYSRDKPHVLDYEAASMYLSADFYSDLKLSEDTCLQDLFRKTERPGDLGLYLYPNMHGFNEVPLWIWGGVHDYRQKQK